mmetsp:Transcript_16239/g.44483  ORF Transcript_16239/g.44483 Transcript_16239/m.44483 type:complete len:316 (+) Transcript_16239:88-1035(+)
MKNDRPFNSVSESFIASSTAASLSKSTNANPRDWPVSLSVRSLTFVGPSPHFWNTFSRSATVTAYASPFTTTDVQPGGLGPGPLPLPLPLPSLPLPMRWPLPDLNIFRSQMQVWQRFGLSFNPLCAKNSCSPAVKANGFLQSMQSIEISLSPFASVIVSLSASFGLLVALSSSPSMSPSLFKPFLLRFNFFPPAAFANSTAGPGSEAGASESPLSPSSDILAAAGLRCFFFKVAFFNLLVLGAEGLKAGASDSSSSPSSRTRVVPEFCAASATVAAVFGFFLILLAFLATGAPSLSPSAAATAARLAMINGDSRA